MVGHGERFLETLGLVVHAAFAHGVHMAPVGLVLRMHLGIAVHLAGAGHEDAGLLRQRETEQVVCAQRADLQCLDGDLLVVDR